MNSTTQTCRRNYPQRDLGVNARDNPANVSLYAFPNGVNRIVLTSHEDVGTYVALLRFARVRSDEVCKPM